MPIFKHILTFSKIHLCETMHILTRFIFGSNIWNNYVGTCSWLLIAVLTIPSHIETHRHCLQ